MSASNRRYSAEWRVGRRWRDFIVRAQGGRCASCGERLNLSKRTKPTHADYPTLDHCHPKCRGGGDGPLNKIAMHRKCNNRKASRPPTGCELIMLEAVMAHLSGIGVA